jgi:hypothetical protein
MGAWRHIVRLPGTLLSCLLIFGSQQLFAQPQQCISYLHGKEWRLYCPSDGSDHLLFATTEVPQYISWNQGLTDVYFVAGTTLFTAPWKLGATARKITSVPEAADRIDRVWKDPKTGAIGLVALGPTPGDEWSTTAVFYRKRTDQEPWLLVGRRKTDCDSDEGSCGRVFASPHDVVFLDEQLRDMSVGSRLNEYMPGVDRSDEEKQYRLPARTVPGSVIITTVVTGDTEHAMSPLKVVLSNGKKLELKACAEDLLFSNGQLSFEESGGFLLVGSEYKMACPTLLNLSSGELKALPKDAHAAVWVPRPPKI